MKRLKIVLQKSVFFILLCCFADAAAQTRITGVVLDPQSQPIEGVSVIARQGGQELAATTSNREGAFSITGLQAGAVYSLHFTHVGYEPYVENDVVLRSNMSALLIRLRVADKDLDQVVVVGYGTQSRRTITSAISKYDGSRMEGAAVNSVGDDLKGKMSGLRVTTTDMQPGSNPRFLIRGGSSINQSNDPIILVDGTVRDMTGLNPNDIESVEVLKDAASAGVYGARASNGVILITTKKGKRGAAQVVFDAQVGRQEPETKFNLMNAADYLRTIRPALAESLFPSVLNGAESAGIGNNENSIWTTRYLADGETVPAGWQSIQDPVDPTKTLIFQDNNQQNQWFRPSGWQTYHIGVNGGSDKILYATSMGYTDDGGIGVNTGFNAFTFHGNTSADIVKNLNVSSTFDYGQTNLQDLPDNKRNTVIRGLSIPHTHRDYLADGTPALGTNNTTPSAAFYNAYYDRRNVQKRSSFNLKLNWSVTNDLNAVVQATNFNRHTRSSSYIKGNAVTSLRDTREGFSELNRLNVQAYLNYKKTFNNDHQVDILAGHDYNYDKMNSVDAAVTGSTSDKVPTLNSGTTNVAGFPPKHQNG